MDYLTKGTLLRILLLDYFIVQALDNDALQSGMETSLHNMTSCEHHCNT